MKREHYTIGKMFISIWLMCAYDTLVILTKIIQLTVKIKYVLNNWKYVKYPKS